MSQKPKKRREVIGTVISDKMDKTVVVRVEKTVRHPVYEKVLRKRQNYKAHDKNSQAKLGDRVQIAESKPISKTKRWSLVKVLSS